MDSLSKVKERFQFTLPNDYLTFFGAGLLENDQSTGLRVSRHFWLSPDEIASCQWPSYKTRSLVPCAQTPGRDHLCWFVAESEDPWIAECPRDSDMAEGFAPHFEGLVFRSLLEEFADSWQTVELNEVSPIYQRYVERVAKVMRRNWVEILWKCASQPVGLNEWKRPKVISAEYMSHVISSELVFPFMGSEFRQHVE